MSGLALAAPLGALTIGPQVIFTLLAAFAAVTALVVVLHRNLVVEALFLVLHLLTIAGLYLLLGARFFAAIQVIVYSGAIAVLIVFVIMLLTLAARRAAGPESHRSRWRRRSACCSCCCSAAPPATSTPHRMGRRCRRTRRGARSRASGTRSSARTSL